MKGINIPLRKHRKGLSDIGTYMDKFYKHRTDDNEIGSFYYSIYIDFKTNPSFKIEDVLNILFEKRQLFEPTFIMWCTTNYGLMIQCTILIQLSKPISEKKLKIYMEPSEKMFDVWKLTCMENSYEFIDSILQMYKKKNLFIWNATANGLKTESYDTQPFCKNTHYLLNMTQQAIFQEMIQTEEWGQLLLW